MEEAHMTSEGSQHPGYEPDEAAPDAGGPRRHPTEEPWAPAGYEPPQRTDQWAPPAAPWGTPATARRDPNEPPPYNGFVSRDQDPQAPYTPAPAPIPQAPEPTPLPPQQTRVPGASFGAFPPGEPAADGGYGAIDYHGKTE